MISLIICSRTGEISTALKQNIQETIGVAYELIVVDNSQSKHSIFSAYNLGASKSQYENLCFLHDDIIFRSENWGKNIIPDLEKKETGVIGVAGAVYKSDIPSPWWITNYADMSAYIRSHIIQHSGKGRELTVKLPESGEQQNLFPVVVVDGVWFCCRKNLWKIAGFDEWYDGFHFYDLDFSLDAFSRGFKNYVTRDVLLEHFSAGHLDSEWIRAAMVFHKKWKNILPAGTDRLSTEETNNIKKEALKNILLTTGQNKYNGKSGWFSYWLQYLRFAPLQRDTYSILWGKIKSGLQ